MAGGSLNDAAQVAPADLDILWGILFARAHAARKVARDEGQLFVHYTRADTAMRIIQGRKVWMRNATVMNDFQEVAWGQAAFLHAWNSDNGRYLCAALNSINPAIVPSLTQQLPIADLEIRFSTFLTSMSEHDPRENARGRLSMWRAYGTENGVALVLKNTPFLAESNTLGAYSAPVWYATPAEMADEFGRVAAEIVAASDQIRRLPPATIAGALMQMHRFALLTTKHPGFLEEREWRIVHSPDYERSKVLGEEVVSVNGVLQRIYTIPLENDPYRGLFSAALPDLLDRIIVGPTQYPHVVFDGFVRLLEEAGVPDPRSKVVVSDIPLRQ
jgi:hypothetical protein